MEFISQLKALNQETIDLYYESKLFACRDALEKSLEGVISKESFGEKCNSENEEEAKTLRIDLICRLGLVYNNLGEFDQSELFLQEYKVEEGDNELRECKIRYTQSKCYISMKKYHLAEEELEYIVELGS